MYKYYVSLSGVNPREEKRDRVGEEVLIESSGRLMRQELEELATTEFTKKHPHLMDVQIDDIQTVVPKRNKRQLTFGI